jgi:hypothetical protein
MKLDLGNIVLVIGITVILVNVFFHDLFFGFNIPVIVIALGSVLFALFRKNERKKNK